MKTWSEWEPIRRQVAIGGWVSDETGQGKKDLIVNIVAMPDSFSGRVAQAAAAAEQLRQESNDRPDRAVTQVRGGFYFLDLPDGQYSLKVVDPVSGLRDEQQAAVQRDKTGKINAALFHLQLH